MTALFAGSFDPPSLGHLDIIVRAAKLFPRLIVGVAQRQEKLNKGLLPFEARVSLLKELTKDLANVEVMAYEGLTIEFAAANQVKHLVRGLRLTTSFQEEFQMALANRVLSTLETVFILGDENLSHISSTLIREIASKNASLEEFVSPAVEALINRMSGR